MEAFFRIHSDLPREGPGDLDSLNWALGHVELPQTPRILDAGCGPGADIPGLLAHRPQARIVAMETHAPFADRVTARFADDPRVSAVVGDMSSPKGLFDLIWCAGAIYFLGVQAGLAAWRKHLAPNGAVVFSELSWTGVPKSPKATEFWAQYPAMQDCDGVLEDVKKAGYRVVAYRFLPKAAWAAYYEPLQDRINHLRESQPDAEMLSALDTEQAEIDLWRAHGDEYGYLQVVAAPA